SLDRVLRADRTDAETAYGLATTAVLLLERWGGGGGGGRDGGLGALIDNLAREPTFDAALRATYHVTEGDFESRWQRDVAQRYGWISWAGAAGVFWAALGLVLAWLVRVRRRRDRARKALLDEGWTVPEEDGPTAGRAWNWRVNSRPDARPESGALATALRTEELGVSRRRCGVARSRVLAPGTRVDHGRPGSARSRLLRFLSGRPRPLGTRGATGE